MREAHSLHSFSSKTLLCNPVRNKTNNMSIKYTLLCLLLVHNSYGSDVTLLESYAWPLKGSVISFLDNVISNPNYVPNGLTANCSASLKEFSFGLKNRKIWSMKSEFKLSCIFVIMSS